jgi:hypothetical protein
MEIMTIITSLLPLYQTIKEIVGDIVKGIRFTNARMAAKKMGAASREQLQKNGKKRIIKQRKTTIRATRRNEKPSILK